MKEESRKNITKGRERQGEEINDNTLNSCFSIK